MLNSAINYDNIAIIKTQMLVTLASILIKQKPRRFKIQGKLTETSVDKDCNSNNDQTSEKK